MKTATHKRGADREVRQLAYFSKTQLAGLKKKAKRNNTSVAALLRHAIDLELAESVRTPRGGK
jgi:hypothetical protein